MNRDVLKKYILFAIIVLVNIILIILTSVSVIKSVKRIESGEIQNSEFKTNIVEQEESFNEQEDLIDEKYEENPDSDISAESIFDKILSIEDYINMQNLQLCSLIIIGINLLILAILIFRKIH